MFQIEENTFGNDRCVETPRCKQLGINDVEEYD